MNLNDSKFRHLDINCWYRDNNGKCPTCGLDLRTLPPEANIYPHFAKQCGDLEHSGTRGVSDGR